MKKSKKKDKLFDLCMANILGLGIGLTIGVAGLFFSLKIHPSTKLSPLHLQKHYSYTLDEYQMQRVRLGRINKISFEAADKDSNHCLTGEEKPEYHKIHRRSLYQVIQSEEPQVTCTSLDSLTTKQLEDYILDRAEREVENMRF